MCVNCDNGYTILLNEATAGGIIVFFGHLSGHYLRNYLLVCLLIVLNIVLFTMHHMLF